MDQLAEEGQQINASKSHWAVIEVEYLGFSLTSDGLKPQPKKVDAIPNMEPPVNN